MSQRFDFEVNETKDSLEYLELRISDSTKIIGRKTVEGGCRLGGGARRDSSTNMFTGQCASLLWISVQLEQKLNIYNEDETHTLGTYFDYQIPLELLDSYEKLPELTTYLEENLGLTLIKTKKLEKVYTIQFKNQ